MTSDKYMSLMNGFFENLNKNWPTNFLDIYVSLENKIYSKKANQNIQLINTPSKDWSKRFYETLSKVKSKYIILLLDDYWIIKEIKDEIIFTIFDFVIRENLDYISYLKNPSSSDHKLKFISNSKDISFYKRLKNKDYNYFISASYIYNVDFLKNILRKYENAWDFEINASFRYLNYKNIKNYCFHLNDDPFNFLKGGIIHKGEVSTEARKYFIDNHIDFNWKSQKLNVSTNKTPVLIRLIRKAIRGPKKYLSLFFFKF